MKGYKHLTADEKAEIRRLYDETKSTRVTADRLGLALDRVAHTLKRQGVKLTRHGSGACYRHAALVTRMAQEGCSYSAIGRAIGTTHHRVHEYLDRFEIPHPGHIQTGPNNPNWKGGRKIDKDGYVLLYRPDHPMANKKGYVREHRLVISEILGRPLTAREVVHHRDDDHQNNDPGNLVLYRCNGDHLAETLKGKVPNWSPEGKARMRAKRPRRGRKDRPTRAGS